MKILLANRLLISIFLLALLLRTVNLSTLPAGFHADEVRVGWNAYSILKTGEDDRGNTLALYYDTFGDYRPTGIFYVTIPFIFLFGLNEFVIRLPAAMLGALTVIPLYLLSLEITKKKNVALIATAILAISPWHISTSRATSEVVISMFIGLWGLYFFLKANSTQNKKLFLYSFVSFGISYFFYHSIRLLAPIFVLSLILYHFKQLNKTRLLKSSAWILGGLLGLTLFISLSSSARGRLSQVSLANDLDVKKVLSAATSNQMKTFFDNKTVIYATSFIKEYSKYLTVDFLLGENPLPLRYSSPMVGLLTYAELIFLLIGIVVCIKKKIYLPLLLLLLAPIAAALTHEDSPNLHRSLFMLPFIAVIISIGIDNLVKGGIVKSLALKLIILLLILNWYHFAVSYTTRAKEHIGFWRNYAAKDLIFSVEQLRDQYENVIITNDPDDPYPWYAFYHKKIPKEFNALAVKRVHGPWNYENIVFTQDECPSGDIFPGPKDKALDKNVLVIDGFKCPIDSKIKDGMQARVLKQLFNPDGSVAYTFWIKK